MLSLEMEAGGTAVWSPFAYGQMVGQPCSALDTSRHAAGGNVAAHKRSQPREETGYAHTDVCEAASGQYRARKYHVLVLVKMMSVFWRHDSPIEPSLGMTGNSRSGTGCQRHNSGLERLVVK